ncbi:MAG TPA: hypothetical protein PKV66_05555 [Candidatus Pelethenecus sp.]|nr:hypothetical protein [Candidatus Pelethenecus sp.]
MNIALCVGVLLEDIRIKQEQSKKVFYFRLGVVDEADGTGQTILCRTDANIGFKIYSKAKEGTPLVIRGHLRYNKLIKANYVEVSYVEVLYDAFGKDVKMSLKELLDIYQPANMLQEVRKIVKEQEKKEKEQQECSH